MILANKMMLQTAADALAAEQAPDTLHCPRTGSDKRGSVDFPIWRSERHTARADAGALSGRAAGGGQRAT